MRHRTAERRSRGHSLRPRAHHGGQVLLGRAEQARSRTALGVNSMGSASDENHTGGPDTQAVVLARRCLRMKRVIARNARCLVGACTCVAALSWLGLISFVWTD